MERENSIFIKLINDMEREIKNLKGIYESDKQYVDEIDVIISKLKNIQSAFKPKEKILKERIRGINKILTDIEDIRSNKILKGIGEIYINIENNLLDGMEFRETENNNERLIVFENNEVGRINVLKNEEQNIIMGVNIYDKKEEFEINNPVRTYNIISFINTNFNYK